MPTKALNGHNLQSHVPQEQRPINRSSLIATIITTLLIRIANRTSFVILGFYLGEHFASATIVAAVLETFYLSELIIAPMVGSLSDRWGRKFFLLLAPIIACTATLFLLSTARLFPHPYAGTLNLKFVLLLFMLCIGRLLEGTASGMNVPATLGYITDVTVGSERTRARVMTAFEIVTVAGLALAIPFGGKISSSLDTWGFLVVAALYLLILLIIIFWVRENKAHLTPEQKQASLLEGLTVIRYKRIFTFLPAWFSVNALVGSWTTLITIILAYPNPAADNRHPGQLLYGGFSKMGATLWVGLFALAFLLGMGLWVFFTARFRRTTIMLIGLGGLLLTVAVLTTINSLAENPLSLTAGEKSLICMLLPSAIVGVMLLSGFTPVALSQMSTLAETLPGRRGAVMGLYSVVLALGQLLGALLGGFCVDQKGFYGLMIFSVGMGLTSLASVLYIRSQGDDLLTTHKSQASLQANSIKWAKNKF